MTFLAKAPLSDRKSRRKQQVFHSFDSLENKHSLDFWITYDDICSKLLWKRVGCVSVSLEVEMHTYMYLELDCQV